MSDDLRFLLDPSHASALVRAPQDPTLVTHNTREFSRVNGLRVDDWLA